MNRDPAPRSAEAYLASPHKQLSRRAYLQVVKTAISVQSYRFAREAVLYWLAAYPGDLAASLYYAQVLLSDRSQGDKRLGQARMVLQGLCAADPEFSAALENWLLVEALLAAPVTGSDPGALLGMNRIAAGQWFALHGASYAGEPAEPWASNLHQARQALRQGNLAQAENFIRQTLEAEPNAALAAATHLQYLDVNRQAPLAVRLELAERYQKRFPACLACGLYQAEWLMESGDSARAVRLLHQAAARDIGGQVARRMWGDQHPYLRLWPEGLALGLKAPVPADVGAVLGWNRLFTGTGTSPAPVQAPAEQKPAQASAFIPVANVRTSPVEKADTEAPVLPAEPADTKQHANQVAQPEAPNPARQGLARLAKRLKLKNAAYLDGRYPVYVVFTLRQKLASLYGSQGAQSVEVEIQKLLRAVQGQPGWGGLLFFADDVACTEPLGITPLQSSAPWALKLVLADLDAALKRKGAMIGALLIVGGPEVVPFHRLPNPVDDDDVDVPSDAPYATRDENYFIPEWPVGRLPAGIEDNPGLLISALSHISARYIQQQRRRRGLWRGLYELKDWLWPLGGGKVSSLGYTAAIWKKSAAQVFRQIGDPRSLRVSPPLGIESAAEDSLEIGAVSTKWDARLPRLTAQLGYFNLHGMPEVPGWYGECDPFLVESSGDGANGVLPAPPVALRPQDIDLAQRLKMRLPEVIFSEACYGLNVQGKSADQVLALKFLQAGSLAVIGSTCVSYGSINGSLSAADLLGHAFWGFLKSGLPAGEALRQAKIRLVHVMQQRQGYLDGEDQKTLTSFILYGDPLAQPFEWGQRRKSVRRMVSPPEHIRIVCDRSIDSLDSQGPIPEDVLASVKQVVARYLPGMAGANLAYTQERETCSGRLCQNWKGEATSSPLPCQLCTPAEAQAENRSRSLPKPNRRLVTLSKPVSGAQGVHLHFARLTLDAQGKLVKLVVSH